MATKGKKVTDRKDDQTENGSTLTEKQAERIRQSIELMAKTVPMKIDELLPYQRNQKDHPEEQVRNLANSLRRFGWVQPVVIDERNVIVIGHGRVLGAKRLGLTEAPVVRTADLTEDEIRELRIVDNKLNESEWNEYLAQDLQELTFEGFDFSAADLPEDEERKQKREDWFNREKLDGDEREEGNDEYNEFLDKFEGKKTTDDCYTPPNIYEAVADWVAREWNLDRKKFMRPFYPGGNYQKEKYPKGTIVVDNPPFSILSDIIRWYCEKGIKFFLFAPSLTLFTAVGADVEYMPTGVQILYENGATVHTSFINNIGESRIHVAPDLYEAVNAENDVNLKAAHKDLPKYEYPYEAVLAAQACRLAKYGQELKIPKAECVYRNRLDAQKELGKDAFGGLFLLSERAAAERAAATTWTLSEEEISIVKSLGQAEPAE